MRNINIGHWFLVSFISLGLTACTTTTTVPTETAPQAVDEAEAEPMEPQGPLALSAVYSIAPVVLDGALVARISWQLKNISEDEHALWAPNPCKVTTWQIVDGAGNLLHEPEARMCVQALAEKDLPAGEQFDGDIAIAAPLTSLPADANMEITVWRQPFTLPINLAPAMSPQGERIRHP